MNKGSGDEHTWRIDENWLFWAHYNRLVTNTKSNHQEDMLLISSDRKHAKRAPVWMRSWEIQNWVVQSGDLIQGNQAVKPSAII